MYIHVYTLCVPACVCVCMYAYVEWVFLWVQARIVHSLPSPSYVAHENVIQTSCKILQGFVEAFIMGTHARLGAHSPVVLLDPYLAVSIAQIIIADRW
jgi:hypothetical protein